MGIFLSATIIRQKLYLVKMFSRLALTTGVSPKPNSLIVLARATHTTPALKNEERDLVNFPRRKRPVNSPKVRMGFLPDEWFTAFYSKTGVTGPYMLGVGLATFLISNLCIGARILQWTFFGNGSYNHDQETWT